jgi:hypothetical protein
MESWNKEYRLRFSEDEINIFQNCLKEYILHDYKKMSISELGKHLRLLIKIITLDRRFRRKFEKRIDKIIEELNKGKVKNAERIINGIIKGYKKIREKIIIEKLDIVERKTFELLLENRFETEEELKDYFFSFYSSQGASKNKMNKAYNEFLKKLFRYGFKGLIIKLRKKSREPSFEEIFEKIL